MNSLEDVATWVRAHDGEGTGAADLKRALSMGQIAGNSAKWARAWLIEHEEGDQRRFDAEQLELARRSTEAAEVSAAAATDSARHARESVKWSKFAVLVASVALIVAAWPFIKDVGR